MTTQRLTRKEWGAIPVDPKRPTRLASTLGTALHWVGGRVWGTAGPAGRHSLCAGKVLGIQRSHMAGEWYDGAYNEVACPHGVRFELRGHNVQTGANGTTAGNASHYAILALVGEGDPITAALLDALEDAFEDYRRNAGAGPDTTTHRAILRLYSTRTTQCPGDALTLVEGSGRFMHRPAPTPPPAPVPTTYNRRRNPMLVQIKGKPEVYVTDGLVRRHLPNTTALADFRAVLRANGAPAAALEPHIVASEARALAAYGPIVKAGA